MKKSIFLLMAIAAVLASCKNEPTPPPPDPTLEADFRYYILDDGKCEFINASSSGLTAYEWDFGDGTSVRNVESVTHQYAASGTYTVSLSCQGEYATYYFVQKKVTISKSSGGGGGGGQTPSYSKVYIKGFRLYKIPKDNYYYNIKWEASSFGGSEELTTDKKELYKSDLPKDYILKTPRLLEGGNQAFKWYSEFTVSVFYSFYSWQNGAQCLRQSVEPYFEGKMDGKEEYVFTSSTGETQVAILFQYE